MALLTTNKKYKGEFKLSFLESLATNETIAGKLRAIGFSNVMVTGEGSTRVATGVWYGPDKNVDLPSQVKVFNEM